MGGLKFMKLIKNKIVIIGAGMVGAATLNSVLALGMCAEIVIIDLNIGKARGEALDASHTTSSIYSPNVNVREGDFKDCSDAQIIIVTAGASGKQGGHQDRNELASTNIKIIDEIMKSIILYTKDAIIIMVTNPVDILTYIAQNNYEYPKKQIIGSGTMLDTARFRRILAKKYFVDTKNVNGFILGEHGETAFATWSILNISGINISDLNKVLGMDVEFNKEEIINEVKNIGHEILNLKGFTNYGIANSVSNLVKVILLNELSIMPVSTTLHGEYDINNISLSIPSIISSDGILKTLCIPLSDDEISNYHKSANSLINILKKLT